jgi:hypothetical protein
MKQISTALYSVFFSDILSEKNNEDTLALAPGYLLHKAAQLRCIFVEIRAAQI